MSKRKLVSVLTIRLEATKILDPEDVDAVKMHISHLITNDDDYGDRLSGFAITRHSIESVVEVEPEDLCIWESEGGAPYA